jgi:NAD-dependent dihydropyrimidine dehydrogenase PreA subunit
LEISAPTTIAIEVSIDRNLCCDYRICLEECSMGVFELVDNEVCPVKMHLCCSCLKCDDFCPTHAISTRWTVRA